MMTWDSILVYPVGTKVTFEDIEMTVTAIKINGIRPNRVLYECTWTNGREVKEYTFFDWQLSWGQEPYQKIGFYAIN